MKKKKIALALAVMAAQTASVVAQPAAAPSSHAIRIGVIGPLTGPSSDFGLPMLNGVRLAIDEINSFGGYLGRPLELVVKDDQANPDLGLKMSQELIKDKVITRHLANNVLYELAMLA